MPRHRSLNLKKFIDSIPEPLIEEYFKQKVEGGASFSLKTFDRLCENSSFISFFSVIY